MKKLQHGGVDCPVATWGREKSGPLMSIWARWKGNWEKLHKATATSGWYKYRPQTTSGNIGAINYRLKNFRYENRGYWNMAGFVQRGCNQDRAQYQIKLERLKVNAVPPEEWTDANEAEQQGIEQERLENRIQMQLRLELVSELQDLNARRCAFCHGWAHSMENCITARRVGEQSGAETLRYMKAVARWLGGFINPVDRPTADQVRAFMHAAGTSGRGPPGGFISNSNQALAAHTWREVSTARGSLNPTHVPHLHWMLSGHHLVPEVGVAYRLQADEDEPNFDAEYRESEAATTMATNPAPVKRWSPGRGCPAV